MWQFFTDAVIRWGLPALILVFWYLHNREQTRLFGMMLAQAKEQNDKNFEQTQQMIDQMQYLGGLIGRVENKIDGNQFCPVIRAERGDRRNG